MDPSSAAEARASSRPEPGPDAPGEPFASSEVRYLQRNWDILGNALGTLVMGFGLVFFALVFFKLGAIGAVGIGLAALAGYFFAVAGLFRLIVAWVLDEKRVPVPGKLLVHDGSLFWNGRRMARQQALTAGFVARREEDQVRVRLVRTLGRKPLVFVVRDEEEGRNILRALGLDAAQVTAGLDVASLARVHPLAVWANGASALSLVLVIPVLLVWSLGSPGWLVPAAFLGLGIVAWAALYLAPARVRVGVDGLLVTWLRRRRFIRYEDLAAVRSHLHLRPDRAEITLSLHGGEEIRLPLAGFRTLAMGEEELSLRVRRIEQAAEESRRVQADRAVSLPPRGDRPAHAWLAVLRAAGTGADADHRRAPVTPDTLLRIAEDHGSTPERRVAAAAALGPALDAPARSRLRIAASTTVAPEVRDALSLAATEEASDDALAAALDRVVKRRA